MNVFLLTDVEGLPGIDAITCMDRDSEAYARTRRLLTDTVNLAASVCRDCGAEAIWYLDGHAGGGNILSDQVVPYARQITLAGWQELIRTGQIDCQLELGCHARAGTVGGFLDHTFNSRRYFRLTVNGREFSELAVHAAFCGAFGVPVVFCSGDETACRQAQEYVPAIVTAPVKQAAERNVCTLYGDPTAILTAGISQALQTYQAIPPMKLSLPAEIVLTYYRTDYCEEALASAGDEAVRIDARTLKKTVTAITRYEDLKF